MSFKTEPIVFDQAFHTKEKSKRLEKQAATIVKQTSKKRPRGASNRSKKIA